MRRTACLGALLRGFMTAVVLVATALIAAPARAGDDSGALQFLLQNSRQSSFPLFAPPRALQPAIPRYLPREQPRSYTPRASSEDGGSDGPSATVSGGVICVRMCDGFYFPVLNGSMETRETICRATCPDAETQVFRGSHVESAVGDNGQRYGDLKVAFLYRKERVEGCTCRRNPGDRSKAMSVMNDPTLKAGDTIVTSEGAVVFSGGNRPPPFRLADFVPLQDARMLSQPARQRIASLLGLNRDTMTARLGRPLPATGSGSGTAAGDESIPEITITRRGGDTVASTTPVSASDDDAAPTGKRVILPGPWATPR
jgi:hypothetical protein